jgi:hypothetical protein
MAKTRKGLWTGVASGAATGAGVGSTFGPIGTAIGGVGGAILGGISGSQDDSETEAEQARIDEETRKRDMESQFSHLMALKGSRREDRSLGLNTLTALSSQRANAEANARRRAMRSALLAA